MQICKYLLRVIFMLSTIVSVTDCCSSRLLLLRERTLNMGQQQMQLQFQQQQQQQQQSQQDVPQNVDIVTEMDFNPNFYKDPPLLIFEGEPIVIDEDDQFKLTTEQSTKPTEIMDELLMLTTTTHSNISEHTTTEESPLSSSSSSSPSSIENINRDAVKTTTDMLITNSDKKDFNKNVSTTDPTVRDTHAGDPTYQVIDFYYTVMRDVLSFECTGQFLTDFCLNGGRCFRYPVGNHSFFSCECADGYVGERCESKSLNELYVPSPAHAVKKPKIQMARIVFSFPMLIALSVTYIVFAAIIVFKCPNTNRAAGMLGG